MTLSVAHLESNAGILRYLADGDDPRSVSVERPTPETDTGRLGARPDIVDRLWTGLNAGLPADARYLVAGGAALVHPQSGAVLALALGTQYAIRLPADRVPDARARGYVGRHTFQTVGRTLDVTETFGPAWVFGRRESEEIRWLAESYAESSP
jgi:hypothetical protein